MVQKVSPMTPRAWALLGVLVVLSAELAHVLM